MKKGDLIKKILKKVWNVFEILKKSLKCLISLFIY